MVGAGLASPPSWSGAARAVLVPFRRGAEPGTGGRPLHGGLPWLLLLVSLGVLPALLSGLDDRLRGVGGLLTVVGMSAALVLASTRWPLLGWQLGTAVVLAVAALELLYDMRLQEHFGNVWFYAAVVWVPVPALLARVLRGRQLVVAMAVTGVAGLPILAGLVSPYPRDLAFGALVAFGPLVASVVTVRLVRARERAAAAEGRAREARDARTALAERTRIAQEMHDVVAHHFSEVAVRAETAPYRVPDLPDAAVTELRAVAASAREAMDDLRRLLRVLGSPDEADAEVPQPGLADLEGLLERARSAGTDLTWRIDTGGEVPDVVGLTAYRVVAQAMANARQHAALASVEVRVGLVDGALDVDVRNAPGVDHGPGARLGLASLSERVAAHDGALTAGPTDDGGWQLRAVLPLPARETSRG